MSRQASPTLIGGFMVGAAALFVAGILFFTKTQLGGERFEYVVYFDGNIGGLDVGAPVEFNGVPVGRVSDVRMIVDEADYSIRMPVTLRIDGGRLYATGEEDGGRKTVSYGFIDSLIDRGLRARLTLQSLVTGKLKVDLALHGDVPAVKRDTEGRREIPTLPSTQDMLTRRLRGIRFEELVDRIIAAMNAVESLTHSQDLTDTLGAIRGAATDLSALTKGLERGSAATLQQMGGALAQVGGTLARVDGAVAALERLVAEAEQTLSERSPLRQEISESLREIRAAARSIRTVADTIERHPDSLLKGKEIE